VYGPAAKSTSAKPRLRGGEYAANSTANTIGEYSHRGDGDRHGKDVGRFSGAGVGAVHGFSEDVEHQTNGRGRTTSS